MLQRLTARSCVSRAQITRFTNPDIFVLGGPAAISDDGDTPRDQPTQQCTRNQRVASRVVEGVAPLATSADALSTV
jgi:hypothetical protein